MRFVGFGRGKPPCPPSLFIDPKRGFINESISATLDGDFSAEVP